MLWVFYVHMHALVFVFDARVISNDMLSVFIFTTCAEHMHADSPGDLDQQRSLLHADRSYGRRCMHDTCFYSTI